MGTPKRKVDTSGRPIAAGGRQFAIAGAHGMAILRSFECATGPLGNGEIARRAGLPKATVSRLTYTLATRVLQGATALGRAVLQKKCGPELWPQLRAGIMHARQDYEAYGFCFSIDVWTPGLFAIGVPMGSADGTARVAFNCGSPSSAVTHERLLDECAPRLLALRASVPEAMEERV